MKIKSFDLRRYNFLIIALVLVFLSLSYYFLIWVPGQKRYVIDRNFRLLGVMSNQIKSKIENFGGVLNNAVNEGLKDDNKSEKINEVIGLTEDLEVVNIDKKPSGQNKIKGNSIKEYEITLDFLSVQQDLWLYLNYSGETNSSYRLSITVKSDFEKLFGQFIRRNVFDDVLLVDNNGAVIYQRENVFSGLVIKNMDTVRSADRKNVEFKSVGHSSGMYNLEYVDSDYKLFSQPVKISLQSSITEFDKEPQIYKWILCGLMKTNRFNSESREVSLTMIGIFIFIIVATAFSLPVLKVWYIGQRERLKVSELFFLVISIMICTSLAAFLIFDLYVYKGLTNKLNKQLGELASDISKNFNSELNSTFLQIDDLKKLEKDDSTGENRLTNILEEKDTLINSHNPYFDMVYWIDKTGKQIRKWTVKKTTTPLINVSKREYFKNIKKRHLSYIMDDGKSFWLQPIYSWNTGDNELILSVSADNDLVMAVVIKPQSLIDPVLPDGFGYCIIENNGRVLFHSDEKRNLYENFFDECRNNRRLESAVFGRTVENLFTYYQGKGYYLHIMPVKNLPWFIVTFREAEILSTFNIGISSTFLLLFFGYLFICLIVFLIIVLIIHLFKPEKAGDWLWPDVDFSIDYWQLNIFYLMLILSFLFLLFGKIYIFNSCQGIITAILLSFLTMSVTYLKLKHSYVQIKLGTIRQIYLIIIGVVIFIYIISLLYIYGYSTTVLFSIISLLCGLFVIYFNRSKLKRFYGFGCHNGYIISVILILTLTSIFPSINLFKFSNQIFTELFVKQGQLSIARGLEERVKRVKNEYDNIEFKSDPIKNEFLNTRLELNNTLDIYHEYFFDTQINTVGSNDKVIKKDLKQMVSNFVISKLMFPFNQTGVEIRDLVFQSSSDTLWTWKKNPGDAESIDQILHLKKYRAENDGVKTLRISSKVPIFHFVTPKGLSGFFTIILIILFVIILYLVVYKLYGKIFHPDLEHPFDLNDSIFDIGVINNNYLMVGLPFSGKSNRIREIAKNSKSGVFVIDFKEFKKTGENSSGIIDPKKIKKFNTIALDNFDYKINDSEFNLIKFSVLEELIYTHKKYIIIISSVDLSHYFFSSENGSQRSVQTEKLYEQEQKSVRLLLRNFIKICFNPLRNWKRFDVDFEKYKNIDYDPGNLDKLMEILTEECNPTVCLQKIGSALMESPDFPFLKPDQLINKIRILASQHYYDIWSSCTDEEKLTLFHLAQKGTSNSENYKIVRRLINKYLVRENPPFELFNKSFQRFVISTGLRENIISIEKEGADSSWRKLKTVFFVVLLFVLLFFSVTQPDIYKIIIGLLAALTAGVPAVINLFNQLGAKRAA